jgi:hypothetical protein
MGRRETLRFVHGIAPDLVAPSINGLRSCGTAKINYTHACNPA